MKKQVQKSIAFIPLILLILIICSANVRSQSVVKDSIYSEILKEQRDINIVLPQGFDPGSDIKYEVIYLADGEWTEYPFSFIYKYAQDQDYVPPAILVAVKNRYIDGANQRDRDFLPVHIPQPAISGGADNFLAFLKNELMPYIDKKYNTSGTNSLYGHSYGGLFSMYALLAMPDLFDTYYATDPAFWYNDEYVIKLAGEKLKSLPAEKILWIAGITETYKGMRIDKMDSVLQLKAPGSLHWKVVTFPNEKHNSVGLKGIYDGIKFSNSGYTNSSFTFHPMNGILMPDSSIQIFTTQNFPEINYTTDGNEPTRNSQKVKSGISITAPAQLTVKSFSLGGKYDHLSKGKFEIGEMLKSIKKPRKALPGGLHYSWYKGTFEQLPDFKRLKPDKSGVADSTFKMSDLGESDFACLFEGYFEAESDGHYIFLAGSNDGSKLFLGDKLIIDNDGVKSLPDLKSYVLPLEKGFYPVRLEYFQKEGAKDLNLYYVKPGTTSGDIIPLRLLYN